MFKVSLVLHELFMMVKKRIITEAHKLFHRNGFRSTSMDDLAKHLSISKKTIYQYFKDKDELVLEVSKRHISIEKTEFEKIAKDSHNAIDELFRVGQWLKDSFRDMNSAVLHDIQKYHKESWEIWLEYKNETIKNFVTENLKRGIEDGSFRDNIVPEILAIIRVEIIQMVYDNHIFPQEKFDKEALRKHLFEHFIHGVLSEKGRKLFGEHNCCES